MNNKFKKLSQMTILSNENIAKDTYKMMLDSKEVDFNFLSGTFLNIKLNTGKFILRRPISIYEADETNKTITIIYKVLGEGTKELTNYKKGEVLSVLGPLGTGFPIQDESQNVLLVGGGVGVPPLYELAKRLKKLGKNITCVLGFRDKESVFSEEDFKKIAKVIICTDDGSYGYHGLVTDAIDKNNVEFDTLYSCGPLMMLKSLDEKYRDSKKGYLSFEERMACGIGACYGCMTETKNGLKRVCKDGPVFKLGEAKYK